MRTVERLHLFANQNKRGHLETHSKMFHDGSWVLHKSLIFNSYIDYLKWWNAENGTLGVICVRAVNIDIFQKCKMLI